MESWLEFRTEFVDWSVELLWRQWGGLGIQAAHRQRPQVTVDLEALLVGTWSIGRVEPRLFDAALSWCCEHGELVNQKRLEKLVVQVDDERVTTVGAGWGGNVERYDGASWALHPSDETETSAESRRGLFLDDELEEQFELAATNGRVDGYFEGVGWRRDKFEPRQDLQAPDLRSVENFQLFCRRFFGKGRRAEVMTPLMYGHELSTAELAEVTMYSRRSVQTVLRDLKETGVLDWNPGRGRTTRPALSGDFRQHFQRGLVGDEAVRSVDGGIEFRDWGGFYAGLVPLWHAVLEIERKNYEGFKAQSLLRDSLETAVEFHSRTTIHAPYQPTLVVDSFPELVDEAHRYIDALFPASSEADAARRPSRRW